MSILYYISRPPPRLRMLHWSILKRAYLISQDPPSLKISIIKCRIQKVSHTWFCKNISPTYGARHLKTFPLTSLSPERTSSSLISIRPSRRSVYRSVIRQDTRARWELTHLVKVFFCTASRSSARRAELTLPPTMVQAAVVMGQQGYETPTKEQQNWTLMRPPLKHDRLFGNTEVIQSLNIWAPKKTTSRISLALIYFIFSPLYWRGSRILCRPAQ